MNTLSLPDFSEANILSRTARNREPLAPPQAHSGILKKDCSSRTESGCAVVSAMFRADEVSGDPAQWLQACSDLENLKFIIQGRHSKLVVILVHAQAGGNCRLEFTTCDISNLLPTFVHSAVACQLGRKIADDKIESARGSCTNIAPNIYKVGSAY